jgi:poly(beta-D-mannuronate) lyase
MRKSNVKIIIWLTVFLSLTVYAGEFFVSSAAEINAVLTGAEPGDTLTMISGEWINQQIQFKANGTAEKPILLRAENPGEVVLTGTSTLRIGGTYLIVDGLFFRNGYSSSGAVIEFRSDAGYSHYCRLTNSVIVDYNPASINTDYKWVSLYGSYNRVDHCYFAGKSHSGTTLVIWFDAMYNPPAHYHQIDHNYFGYRPPLGFNGGETIRIGTSDYSMSDSYSVVEDNYFEHCNGETEIISNKSGHNIFRYNTFYECDGTLTLRHGNFATVKGNFFIGNHKSGTGGVRIIGEDHLVYNNYFQDLSGTGLRSAISIMNGVPDSPLNRYFQVKRAKVLYNTMINCNNTIVIGAGADAELSLPPEDCIIANNLGKSTVKLIYEEAQPVNMLWEANIMDGILGIENPGGILQVDPLMALADDSLWRPQAESPAINSAADNYTMVVTDMDGQPRDSIKDIGADEVSLEPVIRRPLTADDVGPDWKIPGPKPPEIIRIQAGSDSLKNAVEQAGDGTIIELISAGGIYENSTAIILDKQITIRAAVGSGDPPRVRLSEDTPDSILFVLGEASRLSLTGLELDGNNIISGSARWLIAAKPGIMSEKYTLFVDSCYLHDAGESFFYAGHGSRADTISFTNTKSFGSGNIGINLSNEADGSGLYNTDQLILENCTFWRTTREAVFVYGGDDIPFTPSPVIVINHCTFDSCGVSGTPVVNARECDFTSIRNSIFSMSPGDTAVLLYGLPASISYCNTFEVGSVELFRSANIGTGMLGDNPLYADRKSGNFALQDGSPVLGKGDDNKNMGDLNWAPVTGFHAHSTEEDLHPATMVLEQNYPNPFNPVTTIGFTLTKASFVELSVYAINGKLVSILISENRPAGSHRVQWNAGRMSSGIYFYRLNAGDRSLIRKMMLLR